MKRFSLALLLFSFLKCQLVYGQIFASDKKQFFRDTSVVHATITANLVNFFKQKGKEGRQYPANFSTTLSGGALINEPILLEVRGHFRKDYCYVPPLKLIFKSKSPSAKKSLGSLKLVSQCGSTARDKEYLLKEFLVYKIYNLLTDMSFRVRLLNLNLVDSSNKKKPITEYAFLIEDIKDLAERNNCVDGKNRKLNTEQTDRRQMTIVAIFQYMIGNTDWSVPANHNARLILSKKDSLHQPYVVPYDFDYSGFVNTDYAVPDENLNIQNVRERLYRGFPRTMAELNDVLDIFKKQKGNIYALINNFDLLTSESKKDLTHYLDEFFDLINRPGRVNEAFIESARTQ